MGGAGDIRKLICGICVRSEQTPIMGGAGDIRKLICGICVRSEQTPEGGGTGVAQGVSPVVRLDAK
jgi:hypothetical protein